MYFYVYAFSLQGTIDTLSIIALEALYLAKHFFFNSDLFNKDFAKNHTLSRSGKIAVFWALAKF